jgi:hypothetical protein
MKRQNRRDMRVLLPSRCQKLPNLGAFSCVSLRERASWQIATRSCIHAFPQLLQRMGWLGLEPRTNALKGRCSTIELPTRRAILSNQKRKLQAGVRAMRVPLPSSRRIGMSSPNNSQTVTPRKSCSCAQGTTRFSLAARGTFANSPGIAHSRAAFAGSSPSVARRVMRTLRRPDACVCNAVISNSPSRMLSPR